MKHLHIIAVTCWWAKHVDIQWTYRDAIRVIISNIMAEYIGDWYLSQWNTWRP